MADIAHHQMAYQKIHKNLHHPFFQYTIPPPPPPLSSLAAAAAAAAGGSDMSRSFPILAISIVGMLTTAFLLLSYYIFVIKCCLLNWHHSDVLLRRFPDHDDSRRQHHVHRLIIDDVDRLRSGGGGDGGGGLDESTIQAIRTLRFRNSTDDSSSSLTEPSYLCECAVCLNEFQEEEKMRMLPNCFHVFHIDCIDTWLHNHSNCPLCRADITTHSVLVDATAHLQVQAAAPPRPDQSSTIAAGLIQIVVVAAADHDHGRRRRIDREQLADHHEPISDHNYSSSSSNYVFRSKLERKMMMNHVLQQRHSMGDECIDLSRGKDDNVQAMRRSFSMDSSCDSRQQLYMAVQEILQQNPHFRGGASTQSRSVLASTTILRAAQGTIEGSSSSSTTGRQWFREDSEVLLLLQKEGSVRTS